MHSLEYSLLVLSSSIEDEKVAAKLGRLAGISHNYTPPERDELDIPEEFMAEMREIWEAMHPKK